MSALYNENKCNKAVFDVERNEWVLIKWENRTDDCVRYTCDNDTGIKEETICIEPNICVDGTCVNGDGMDNGTKSYVIIEIENLNYDDFNSNDLINKIKKECKMSSR